MAVLDKASLVPVILRIFLRVTLTEEGGGGANLEAFGFSGPSSGIKALSECQYLSHLQALLGSARGSRGFLRLCPDSTGYRSYYKQAFL